MDLLLHVYWTLCNELVTLFSLDLLHCFLLAAVYGIGFLIQGGLFSRRILWLLVKTLHFLEVYLQYITYRHDLLLVFINDKKFNEKSNKILINFLMKVFKININKNHHKNFDKIFDACIAEPCLEIYMIVYLYTCTLLKNLATLKSFTDGNADKYIEKNLIRVFKKVPKVFIEPLMLRKISLCFENSYFYVLKIHILFLYYKTLYIKDLSYKKLWFKNISINDFKIFCIYYYLKTKQANEKIFLKIKKNILIKNSNKMPVMNNTWSYLISIFKKYVKVRIQFSSQNHY